MKAQFAYVPSPQVVAARATLTREYEEMRKARNRLDVAEREALDLMADFFDQQDRDERVRTRIASNLAQNTPVVR
jgi:hypothetical protein